ncbi:glycine betaine/L-proline ABC transporter substrate-binding protein ProX [Azospirillum sp. RWY-5-1]|uniref:Glycine betaine/L-proline ABC transporter substrate-binding protein ProX n=1 Tax=Azospirillum oleiclasticum TaxID=2735135 RepID=A0ABX2TA40_9PROT|nr:glycine betaine/L-proline ABC transporter substrate-binding protein ProX [Azospirillum oleiclasticum]NYZ17672.1 glycine betaine/L-proline ABC transporter substrate-binding protein ProX [Azospirillum oleiclasticum]NYZ21150.1 glycine betaine/L-proline ABC transporter substrate-binding protein ProX [Azospirillum oleiclasticum]
MPLCAPLYRLFPVAALAVGLVVGAVPAHAASLPGQGITVQATHDSTAETLFQTEIVNIGLERLGYTVKPILPLQIPAMYLAASTGDVTFTASGWNPLQNAFYERVGGDSALVRLGAVISGATQGYLVDKKTAEAHGIKNVEQLKDPKIAAIFADGGSKAKLIGCPPGWGCERAIEHQLTAYNLRPTVEHVQGDMAVLAADTIARFKEGKPVLYYTYTPLWLSQVLVPGRDVVFLEVPFTALPEKTDPALTTLPDGRNIGFTKNTIHVVANKGFIEKNPAAKAWFNLVSIPIADVNAENFQVYQGEKSPAQIRKHAEDWVAKNKDKVDGWIAQAMQAPKS